MSDPSAFSPGRRRWLGAAVGLSGLPTLPALSLLGTLGGCASPAPSTSRPTPRLRLLGQTRVPHRLNVGGQIVGGLSAIDFDPASGVFWLLSDDRSEFGPARLWRARMAFDARQPGRIGEPVFEPPVILRRPDGQPFPAREVDPEGLRWRSDTGTLLWSSEGDLSRMAQPFVRECTPDGRHLRDFALPEAWRYHADGRRGVRDNLAIEGLALSPDGRHAWAALEGPLIEDGPTPTVASGGAPCRLARLDLASGRWDAELRYPLEPLMAAPTPANGWADNGISELLMPDARHLWVLERSFIQGHGMTLRLFEVDLRTPGAAGTPVAKTLVLDFARSGLSPLDNSEGLCLGPRLADGSRTLWVVSDDNFRAAQVTQIAVFAIEFATKE